MNFKTPNRYANTSMVEEYLYSILNGAVSDHTFAGSLPTAIDGSWDDMVLIDCDLPITDYGTYSNSTVYIFLYARPNPDGTKNVALLNSMENAICEVIEGASDEHYSFHRISNGSDYDTSINWHRNFVNFNLKITS